MQSLFIHRVVTVTTNQIKVYNLVKDTPNRPKTTDSYG